MFAPTDEESHESRDGSTSLSQPGRLTLGGHIQPCSALSDSGEMIIKNKILRNCVYISTGLFLVFVGLSIFTEIADLHPHIDKQVTCPHISLGDNINVTAMKDWGGNLVFFNQSAPYMGSIISLSSSGDETVKETTFDFYGIYYRWIKDARQSDTWWTLMVSFWYPIALFGILPAFFVIKQLRNRKLTSI